MLFACDLASVAFAALLALLLRDNFETAPEQIWAFLPYIATTVAVAAVALVIMGLNRGVWRLSVMSDYLRIVGAAILTVSIAMALGFLTNRLQNVSRALPIIELILIVFALVGLRVFARLLFSWKNRPRTNAAAVPDFSRASDTVLIVGINRLTNLYVRSIDDFGAGFVRIAGILSSERSYQGRSIGPHKVLGQPTDASNIIKQLSVHGVFVSRLVVMVPPEDLSPHEKERLEQAAAKHDVPLQYFAEMLGFASSAPRETPASETSGPAKPVEHTKTAEHRDTLWRHVNRPYWMVKRVLDFVLAAVLLVLLAPVLALVAFVVAFDVGFPIIFWQQRTGARGKPFAIYKFRTMGASHDSAGRRLADEQRISSIGRSLRATRLDELPQLFNVLKGNMSFIGPRPLLPVDQFPGLEARLAIPPGITGWAQVNGGREVSAADKAAMDIWYLKHASLWVDLTICVKTIEMILLGEHTNELAIDAAWSELKAPPNSLLSKTVETHYQSPLRFRGLGPR